MSTRANYIFKSGNKTLATFYIHHDGYPEGAAEYFQKALIFDNGRINSSDAFLRANDNCEISEIHGDIDYLYVFNIKSQNIKCYRIAYVDTGARVTRKKQLYYEKSIYEFINTFYTVFTSHKTYKEYVLNYPWKTESEIQSRFKNENTWVKILSQGRYKYKPEKKYRCLRLVYKEIREATEELLDSTYNYGVDNPNYQHLIIWKAFLDKDLEVLMKGAHHG